MEPGFNDSLIEQKTPSRVYTVTSLALAVKLNNTDAVEMSTAISGVLFA